METINMEKKYLNPRELAQTFSLNTGTLANMRTRKIGPPFSKAGKKILYRIQDVEQWLRANTVKTEENI